MLLTLPILHQQVIIVIVIFTIFMVKILKVFIFIFMTIQPRVVLFGISPNIMILVVLMVIMICLGP